MIEYGTFDCMVLSCDVRVSEWIYIYKYKRQETPSLKQVRYLKFKEQQP